MRKELGIGSILNKQSHLDKQKQKLWWRVQGVVHGGLSVQVLERTHGRQSWE